MSGISLQRSSVGDGYGAIDMKTLQVNSFSSSTSSLVQVNSEAADQKNVKPAEPRNKNLLVLRSHQGVAILGEQFKINQWENLSFNSARYCHSIK